jgi:protein-S-isoprenylcysteine O-methyltransferase Ste14
MGAPKHPNMGKEFSHTDLILPLSALLFFLVWILDSFVLRLSEGFEVFVPDVVQIVLFAGLEVSAIAFGVSSHKALFDRKNLEPTMITDGIFAHVRHPLYLSILLAYLGFVFGAMSIISLIPLVCYVFLFNKMVNYEEEDLVRMFGDKYIEYRRRVPKWIPKLSSSKNWKS